MDSGDDRTTLWVYRQQFISTWSVFQMWYDAKFIVLLKMFSCISSFHSTIILPTTNDNWNPSIIIIQVLFLGDASVGNVLGQVTWTTDRADLHAGSLSGATSVRHWGKQVWTQRQAEWQWSNNTGLNRGPRAGVGPEGLSQMRQGAGPFYPTSSDQWAPVT